MRSADRRFVAAHRPASLLALLLAFPIALIACAEGFAPLSSATAPVNIRALAVRVDAIRVSWDPLTAGNIVSYIVERRVDLTGAFHEVAQVPQSNLAELSWLDVDVRPETIYGYRVRAVTSTGDRSAPSAIGGALTPPEPGIEIRTVALVTAAEALDPDGYDVEIAGPDTVRATLGVDMIRRFSPLRAGRYRITLSGLASRCEAAQRSQEVLVSDTVAVTIVPVSFTVTCANPSRGRVNVAVVLSGADLDPEVTVDALGEASDASLPPALRAYSARRTLTSVQRATAFTDLYPGTYDITLSGLAANCTLQGAPTRRVSVTRGGESAVLFSAGCTGSTPAIDSTRPFVLRNRYVPAAASNGAAVVLTSELDLSARTGFSVVGAQADYFYDATVLRYDSTNVARLPQLTVNATTPGRISVLAASTTPRTGRVKLLEFAFTVIGSTGRTAISSTLNFKATSRVGTNNVPFADSVRIEEDTFAVAAPGAVNLPPTAQAGGPYSSTVGTPIVFTSAGSSDPDGSIVNYAWVFGDGTTATGATVSKTYTTAGTFTVSLTVTDNAGATATDQATVTVASAGGGNTPPIANANGPYSATAGVPFTLNASGSSDPNGAIVTYSWALGNGQTATGPSPSVSYAAAGTYTITLTVTDNGGLTGSDQATVNVVTGTGGGNTLVWNSVFGTYDAINNWVPLTLKLNLSTNLPETPGTEAVRTFVIDSVKWDPAKFTLISVNLGAGISASVNQQQASAGKLSLAGSVASGNQAGDAFGVLSFATIRLRPVGTAGTTGTTATYLGPITGPTSTSFFNYTPRITVTEGTFVIP